MHVVVLLVPVWLALRIYMRVLRHGCCELAQRGDDPTEDAIEDRGRGATAPPST